MTLLPDFSAWYDRHSARIVGWRHDFHAHPELGFEEVRTSSRVAAILREAGLEVKEGIAGTGLVATLPGESQSAIGLRADMDALPLTECSGVAHSSRHDGVMHACGHDGHTVALLAAACFMAQSPPLPQTVHFIFQPAEENLGGGRAIVEDGLLTDFPVEHAYALHNAPGVPLGTFMVRPGAMMAGFDTFDIEIQAEGAHAAMPATGGDAIVAACALVTQLQTIVARQLKASDNALLAITRIEGGSAYNILPERVTLAGSVRWFDAEVQTLIRDKMEGICNGIALAQGVRIALHYEERYPALVNDARATDIVAGAARALGSGPVITDFAPITGSEDFAFILREVPGAYALFGNGPAAPGAGLHGTAYDFNDEALRHAAGFWVALCRGLAVDAA